MRVKHLFYTLNVTNKMSFKFITFSDIIMSVRLKYHKNLARVFDFNIFNLNYIIESTV